MKRYKIRNIGPTTEETVELQYKTYLEISKYRNGKTFKELLDDANKPRR